jgi:hypothetical protein
MLSRSPLRDRASRSPKRDREGPATAKSLALAVRVELGAGIVLGGFAIRVKPGAGIVWVAVWIDVHASLAKKGEEGRPELAEASAEDVEGARSSGGRDGAGPRLGQGRGEGGEKGQGEDGQRTARAGGGHGARFLSDGRGLSTVMAEDGTSPRKVR